MTQLIAIIFASMWCPLLGAGLTESPVPPNGISQQYYNAEVPVSQRNIEQEAGSIKSTKDIKTVFREMLIDLEHCGTGSCSNNIRLNICDYLCLVDVRLDGLITKDWGSGKNPGLKISKEELELLHRIYRSCKVTHYQHWNYSMFTHVSFNPIPQDKKWIYTKLGLTEYAR